MKMKKWIVSIFMALVLIISGMSMACSTNTPPDTPRNILPVNSQTDVSTILTLFSYYASDADADVGDNHKASQWQITATSGDYSSPVPRECETKVSISKVRRLIIVIVTA